jgi:hypothetical protein
LYTSLHSQKERKGIWWNRFHAHADGLVSITQTPL